MQKTRTFIIIKAGKTYSWAKDYYVEVYCPVAFVDILRFKTDEYRMKVDEVYKDDEYRRVTFTLKDKTDTIKLRDYIKELREIWKEMIGYLSYGRMYQPFPTKEMFEEV